VTASPNAAVRAEPRSLGSARARDPLAREVRLLGALLGQVLAEQEGAPALELVERVRERTIALRRGGDPAVRAALDAELASLDTHEIAILARAFSTYFRLVNLAEEKERVRREGRPSTTRSTRRWPCSSVTAIPGMGSPAAWPGCGSRPC
jgi:phosphoenolpyruvate carboxylase